jgi:hypothetical protein
LKGESTGRGALVGLGEALDLDLTMLFDFTLGLFLGVALGFAVTGVVDVVLADACGFELGLGFAFAFVFALGAALLLTAAFAFAFTFAWALGLATTFFAAVLFRVFAAMCVTRCTFEALACGGERTVPPMKGAYATRRFQRWPYNSMMRNAREKADEYTT